MEACGNGVDDDGDGFVDCDDLTCVFGDASCSASFERDCSDQVDNDGDGFADCDDFDCASQATCHGGGLSCVEGLECVANCFGSTSDPQTCVDECGAVMCQGGQTTYNALVQCFTGDCHVKCQQDPSLLGCEQCLDQTCNNAWSDCQTNTCP